MTPPIITILMLVLPKPPTRTQILVLRSQSRQKFILAQPIFSIPSVIKIFNSKNEVNIRGTRVYSYFSPSVRSLQQDPRYRPKCIFGIGSVWLKRKFINEDLLMSRIRSRDAHASALDLWSLAVNLTGVYPNLRSLAGPRSGNVWPYEYASCEPRVPLVAYVHLAERKSAPFARAPRIARNSHIAHTVHAHALSAMARAITRIMRVSEGVSCVKWFRVHLSPLALSTAGLFTFIQQTDFVVINLF